MAQRSGGDQTQTRNQELYEKLKNVLTLLSLMIMS